MEKKTYYINLGSMEISPLKYGNNEELVIYATENEAKELRGKMEKMDDANLRSFFRAHVPFRPYHNDEQNDDYDNGMTEALQMVYDLGSEETRRYITETGVLTDHPF